MKIKISLTTTAGKKVETHALIDCGAKGVNFIDQHFARTHKIPLSPLKRRIPVNNIDGTENKNGDIHKYADVLMKTQGRAWKLQLLVTSLGHETVILGMPWLQLENPDIDWEKKTIVWRKAEVQTIEMEPFEQIEDLSLIISLISGKMTPKARQDWKGTRMAHSTLFHEEEEQ